MLHKMLHENENADVMEERNITIDLEECSTLHEKQDGDSFCDCAIWFEAYEPGEVIRKFKRCNHYYHKNCIDPWMESHVRCPFCNQRVDEIPDEEDEVEEEEEEEEEFEEGDGEVEDEKGD